MGDFAKDYAFGVDVTPTPNFDLPATFEGIVRPDGRVATRNYIGILTRVNCSAHVAGLVAESSRRTRSPATIRWRISPTSMAWWR